MTIERLLAHPSSARRLTALLAAALAGTLAVGAAAAPAGAAPVGSGALATATVDVTATGTVVGTPNTMTLTMGVSTNAATAAAALDRNDNEMNALQAVLTKSGLPNSDLATSNLSISPNYRNNGTISGYNVEDTLTITLVDLATAGTVIDTAAHAVGNDIRVDGISFSISNTSQLLAEARIQAVRNARTEALDLAAGAGATLGPVEKIIDDETQSTTPPPAALPRATSGVPVQPGTESVSVQVEVIYSLR